MKNKLGNLGDWIMFQLLFSWFVFWAKKDRIVGNIKLVINKDKNFLNSVFIYSKRNLIFISVLIWLGVDVGICYLLGVPFSFTTIRKFFKGELGWGFFLMIFIIPKIFTLPLIYVRRKLVLAYEKLKEEGSA